LKRHEQLLNWLTPTSGNHRNHCYRMKAIIKRLKDGRQDDIAMQALRISYSIYPDIKQMYLNPRWIEQLMGLPLGWTMVTCSQVLIIEMMK